MPAAAEKHKKTRATGQTTAPGAQRAGWYVVIGAIVVLSTIILATEPRDDDPIPAATTTEMHVPGLLRVVANIIGWEQNRHG